MRQILALITILVIAAMAADTLCAEDLRINAEIKIRGADWIAGTTSVSSLTPAEKQRLTLPDPVPIPDGIITAAPPLQIKYETRFDWRDKGGVTPVRHQGSCGSCWAFSAIATIESKFLIDTKKNLDLSEQHLVSSCCSAGDCGGGWPDWAFKYIRSAGVPDEPCFKYIRKNTPCTPCAGWEDRAYKIKNYVYVKPTKDDFKWALKEYGPVSVVLKAPEDWYYYRQGVYEPVRDVGWANHAVLLTGWDDSDGCWFIKNSWGSGWGEQGYARVKYGNLEKYNYAYAVTGIIDHGDDESHTSWIKPVSAIASSEYSSRYNASKAIDNHTNTHWFSKQGEKDPEITFSLERSISISKVRAMIYRMDVPIRVNIDVSEDGKKWRQTSENFEIRTGSAYCEIPFQPQQCKHVRMTQTNTTRGYGTCTEFEVWHEEQNCPEAVISVTYTDRTETITLEDTPVSITVITNGTEACKWWH